MPTRSLLCAILVLATLSSGILASELPTLEPLVLLADTNPGPADGIDDWRDFVVGGTLFFEGGPYPKSLWRTDGTSAGTFRLTPTGWNYMHSLVLEVAENQVFFGAMPPGEDELSRLWATDGTPEGTHELPVPSRGPLRAWWGNRSTHSSILFYEPAASDGPDAYWSSDGTPGGTARVTTPEPLQKLWGHQVLGSEFVFLGTREDESRVILLGDGPSGTRVFRNLASGEGLGFLNRSKVPPFLYTVCQEDDSCEIRRTDLAGADVLIGTSPHLFQGLVGNRAFLAYRGEHILTMRTTDITTGATEVLAKWDARSEPWHGWLSRDLMILGKRDPDDFYAMKSLYVSDGTAAGTTRILECRESPCPLPANFSLEEDGTIWFLGGDSASTGRQLFRSDGTLEGTATVTPPCPEPCLVTSHFLDTHRADEWPWWYSGRRVVLHRRTLPENGPIEVTVYYVDPAEGVAHLLGSLEVAPYTWRTALHSLGKRFVVLGPTTDYGIEPSSFGLFFREIFQDGFESGDVLGWVSSSQN